MSTDHIGLLTDAEIDHFYALAQKRQRTSVLSTRVSPTARAAVQALARRSGTTPSRLLGAMLTMLTDADTTAPTRDQLATLRAVCSALGIPADSDGPTIKATLVALLEVAAPPAPSDADPLEAAPEPAQLSAIEQRALAKIKEPAARAKFLALRRQRAVERKASSKPNRK